MSLEKQAAVEAGSTEFNLTAREKQVIGLVASGYTNADIARKFGVSRHTVKHHVVNVFDKLGVSNRLELLLFALHHRLVDYAQTVSQFRRTPPKSNDSYMCDAESAPCEVPEPVRC